MRYVLDDRPRFCTPWISLVMKEVRQRTREHALGVVIALAILFPFPWRIPRFSPIHFTPGLSPLLHKNAVDVAVGAFWGDLIAADPEILRCVRP